MPERGVDLEQSEIERRENTNLRILEWTHGLPADDEKTQSIQQVEKSAGKHVKGRNSLIGWTPTDRPLDLPSDNLSPAPSTGTSINIFIRGVGIGLIQTKNVMIKKLREMRETNGLELNQEKFEPAIERKFKTKFKIPNEYSENIRITESGFILSERASAFCITADMSFNTTLEADFKREYQSL